MAFIKSTKDILPSFGSPTTSVQRQGVATNVGTVTTTMPASGSFAPTISCGRARVKTVSIVAGGTVQFGGATLTDGTTTVNLMPQQTALAANTLMDFSFDFRSDLNGTSMNLIVIAGTQNSVHDFEVVGNP